MIEQGEIAANATLNVDGNSEELQYSTQARNYVAFNSRLTAF